MHSFWAAESPKRWGRSRPNQGFVSAIFSSFGVLNLPPDSGVFSGMWVNGMDFFRGEHCEYSCVHPFLKLNRNLNRVLNWYFFCPFSGTDPS
jgi:hypothetical protein